MTIIEKVKLAAAQNPDILSDRSSVEETLGSNPDYLLDVWGIDKSDLIRLERKGLAMKARYQTTNKRNSKASGPHRVRWIIFKEAIL